LQAAQRALAHFVRNKISRSKVRIVVNRYNRDLGLSKEMIETALKTEVFHLCPSDYESINRSLIEGKLIGNGSAFGKSLIALADKLAGAEGLVQPVKNGSMFGSLISRFRKS
jgi:Flp pilus assembly CpaE family ATPase